MTRMTDGDIKQAWQDAEKREKAKALAAEEKAAYNLDEIRKLERKVVAIEGIVFAINDLRAQAKESNDGLERKVTKLEKRLDGQAKVIKAQSKLIDSVKELAKAELAWKVDELEKRIKHLEGAVFDEGPPVTREDVGVGL